MERHGRQTVLLTAVLILGALGVAAAFLTTLGGFDAAVDLAGRAIAKIDQLLR
jgi:hypothetical protein